MNLGELSVTLDAVLDRFNRNIQDARNGVQKLAGDMRELINRNAALAAAAAGAAIAIGVTLVRAGMDSVATQYKQAKALGATIDGLRAVKEATDDLGLSEEAASAGLAVLNQRLGEAQREASPTAKMLEQLGLKAKDLSRLDADQRLAAIADRVKALGLSSSQAADLARQLGLRGAEWGVLFQQGGEAIRQARKDVDDFGLSISEVDAEQVFQAQEAMEDIGRTIKNIRDQVAIALAPLIGELAARFNQTAREAGGFRQIALNTVEIALKGFAKVADVIQGLRVVFKGVELVAKGFGAAVISVVQIAAEGITVWIDLVIAGINMAIKALNKLPKVEIATIDPFTDSRFMQGLRHLGDEARNEVGDVRAELHELAMQDLPSAKVEGFFNAVRDRARAAAEEAVNARNAISGQEGVEGFGVDNSAAEEKAKRDAEDAKKREQARLQAEQEARAERLEALRKHLQSEADAEIEAQNARFQVLEEMSDWELELLGGYQAVKEQLETEHQKRMKDIRERGMTDLEKFLAMSYQRQVATVAGSIAQMTAGVASGNKALFRINQAAALAQTALDLPAAIIASYKNAGGWPLGAAAAAAMAAAGAAQIAQIKNAKYGSATAPSQAGTPAVPVAPQGSGAAISIQGISAGSLFTGSAVRDLIEAINEAVGDGATIRVS